MGMPSKGTRMRLNLRIPPTLYIAVAAAAGRASMTVNDWCASALADAVKEERA
jgi:predicted HicB family RNase H-like nuclease